MCIRDRTEADPTKLVHRNSFNIASMSFTPEIIYAEIKNLAVPLQYQRKGYGLSLIHI